MLLQHLKYMVAAVTAIVLLTSCVGGLSAPTKPLTFQQSQSVGSHARVCPCLYVANAPPKRGGSVTVYAAGARQDATPIQTISGSHTGLSGPKDIAVDASGNIYVANADPRGKGNGYGSVTVYAAGSTGNIAPIQTIEGNNTGLYYPDGIAPDPVNGDIYVSSIDGSVEIYAPGSNGNVHPIASIAGLETGLCNPGGLALDASGNVYVPNVCAASVTVFGAGANGNVAPIQTISGTKTELSGPYQLALDTSLNMYVVNYNNGGFDTGSVTVYAAGGNGNVAPIRNIAGEKPELTEPMGVAVDGSDNVYVASGLDNEVLVFAAGATGDVKPINEIKGKKTGLHEPQGIVIR
jgi:acylphosphatase